MANTALVSVFCSDRTGLVSALTERLFDIGANLGDTTFAVLGAGAEFTSVCELPPEVSLDSLAAELRSLPLLTDDPEARVSVTGFDLAPIHDESAHVTHHIETRGGDRPGLITRLAEVFLQYGANIVRLSAEVVPGTDGRQCVMRIAAWIPEDRAEACLATVANTCGELNRSCRWERA